ncbi:hypothetical protein [Streptomyces sp. ME19-01-6]|uniref:hypothetical protein n=1 Tax=Streptomyces sp. ME19-01-6 TaxID=3028686 RepID=UPI0029B3D37D|nr:hypothetical protein [Streptomyces sp. ME19-01-6]MDX3233687.1 hypothetical protein [Streptomyces sp. ME19-01-6]
MVLADEYGYQVPRGTAATYPGVYEQLRRGRDIARAFLLFAVAMVPAAVGSVKWLVPVSLDAGVVVAGLAGTLAFFSGLGGAVGLAVTAPKLDLARRHPFQAWPCQLEQTKDRRRLILLLAPDGAAGVRRGPSAGGGGRAAAYGDAGGLPRLDAVMYGGAVASSITRNSVCRLLPGAVGDQPRRECRCRMTAPDRGTRRSQLISPVRSSPT